MIRPRFIKRIFFNNIVIDSKYDKNKLLDIESNVNDEIELVLFEKYLNCSTPLSVEVDLLDTIKDFNTSVVIGSEPIENKIVIDLSKNICFKKYIKDNPELFLSKEMTELEKVLFFQKIRKVRLYMKLKYQDEILKKWG